MRVAKSATECIIGKVCPIEDLWWGFSKELMMKGWCAGASQGFLSEGGGGSGWGGSRKRPRCGHAQDAGLGRAGGRWVRKGHGAHEYEISQEPGGNCPAATLRPQRGFCLSSEQWTAIEVIKQMKKVVWFPLQKDPSDGSVEHDVLGIKQHEYLFSSSSPGNCWLLMDILFSKYYDTSLEVLHIFLKKKYRCVMHFITNLI